MPYSRSLAGVGGRLDGVSEWRDTWEDMVGCVGRAVMLLPPGFAERGD